MSGSFPRTRMRRNRLSQWSRCLVAEATLCVTDLIWPVFVEEGQNVESQVPSMPEVSRYSLDLLIPKVKEAARLGIPAVALFPVVPEDLKTQDGKEAYNPNNLMCRAIQAIKQEVPEIGIIGDVALDPYTSHGQDGLVVDEKVINDETVEILCKQACMQAKAGVDMVAPSDMMDGRIAMIRDYLDMNDYKDTQILAYSAKYCSAFYGPFRDAVGSAGNLKGVGKETYQMNPANAKEALREIEMDINEGADVVMVKPGMPYLDIVRCAADNFNVPIFAYQVSGEYAMIKAASNNGWLDYDKVIIESLLAFKRAGATAILSYAAMDVARIIKQNG